MDSPARRPLKTRQKKWVADFTQLLLKSNLQPDHISILGIAFSLLAATCFVLTRVSSDIFLLLAAIFVQLRLLCNMMDGMVAVEGNRKSKLGDVFNELPDRYEDLFILVSAGYAVSSLALGWAAAACAILTAYVRVFGVSLGTKHYFIGPMAKPQRMFTVTVAAILEFVFHSGGRILTLGLWMVVIGSLITCLRRRLFIVRELKNDR